MEHHRRRSHPSFYRGRWLSATGSLCFSTLIVPPFTRERERERESYLSFSCSFTLSYRGLSPDGPRRQAKDIEFIPGDDWPHATMVQTAGCGLSVRYKRNMSRKMAVKESVIRFFPSFLVYSFFSFMVPLSTRYFCQNVRGGVRFALISLD